MLAAAHASPPDPALLDQLKTQVRQVMTSGTAATRKALLRELVAEVRVQDRHTIRPWFRVPHGTNGKSPGHAAHGGSQPGGSGSPDLTQCEPHQAAPYSAPPSL